MNPETLPDMAEQTPSFEHYSLTLSASLCAPAVRMVVVHAWVDEAGEAHLEFVPVVALRVLLVCRFTRDSAPGREHYQPSTRELAEQDGWNHEGTEEDVDPLVCGEFGLDTIR